MDHTLNQCSGSQHFQCVLIVDASYNLYHTSEYNIELILTFACPPPDLRYAIVYKSVISFQQYNSVKVCL